MAKAWEEIKNARESGDEQARAIAAHRYEELLLRRANPSFVKTRVAEMVLREVTTAAIETARQQFYQMGKGDLLLEIEASMSHQLRLIFDWIYVQSTFDPAADQSSSMVN